MLVRKKNKMKIILRFLGSVSNQENEVQYTANKIILPSNTFLSPNIAVK
jgi:hypothetical protein